MSDLVLRSLDISNFRSIRGKIHAPLDAKVVLVHGENGAGKTSLLSAIELALTGMVQSLERADPGYEKQLLHRSASEGRVLLKALAGTTEQNFSVILSGTGPRSVSALDEQRAAFFRERVFLPQALLGQLLQIYQDAGNDAESPLAQFVTKLLGLDRLDALEAGLKPLADVRNVRKIIDGWAGAENEQFRLDRLLTDERTMREELSEQIQNTMGDLTALCSALQLPTEVREDTLANVAAALSESSDIDAFARLTDQQRRLASIRREIDAAQSATLSSAVVTPSGSEAARAAFARWEADYGTRITNVRGRIEAFLPAIALPSEPERFAEVALAGLHTEKKQLSDRTSQARADITRYALAQDERDVTLRQRDTIDQELARLPSSAGSLGAALAELTSFITDDVCPVCDRDFRERGEGSLSDHVHDKVRTLSASAERLLTLGRTRSEVQVTAERLAREIETIGSRKLDEETLANLDRRTASTDGLITELESLHDALHEGAQLRAADVAARRAVSEAQSRNVALAAARDTLSDFARSIGTPGLEEDESFEAAVVRLESILAAGATNFEHRLAMRRKGADHVATIRTAISRRGEVDQRIAADLASWQHADQALSRAQVLRDQGNAIRSAVDTVRSAIIRREFNDRLNRVWRDLFVRLAPGEPFVPAFRIPQSSTQKLQPKLITEHRDGGEAGGTPGAMLSAGNLNTGALTLFTALHLSVPKELPWLILDDPVQSMDDVHIAHFAALLRTLSKEHGRQVMIAVHDRQLFEYLKLELSPAFSNDSLLTLELSRGPRRDTVCISKRFSYKEETVLLSAA
ncbi:AAA family ATPase [Ochrobactrum sp. WV_118_8]|uniref:AAA family ATPase n=1 Tax=Brucella/Ochrobactrum group TaxID=2826938 RepID=UPI00178C2163|nr:MULTISPECIES: AAA family ATPase [Brucella]MCQ9147829.1 AAA family ATPase [Ochrobactrum sp. BTU2]MCR8493874.1 AAA family ATPase [Brucella anthropi]UGQ24439.1 AAA family ATPase [Brucella anthropi]UYT58138.1 AAA family ATPase [Brucella sp. MAB-22]